MRAHLDASGRASDGKVDALSILEFSADVTLRGIA